MSDTMERTITVIIGLTFNALYFIYDKDIYLILTFVPLVIFYISLLKRGGWSNWKDYNYIILGILILLFVNLYHKTNLLLFQMLAIVSLLLQLMTFSKMAKLEKEKEPHEK